MKRIEIGTMIEVIARDIPGAPRGWTGRVSEIKCSEDGLYYLYTAQGAAGESVDLLQTQVIPWEGGRPDLPQIYGNLLMPAGDSTELADINRILAYAASDNGGKYSSEGMMMAMIFYALGKSAGVAMERASRKKGVEKDA